jgi:hypothetical protein
MPFPNLDPFSANGFVPPADLGPDVGWRPMRGDPNTMVAFLDNDRDVFTFTDTALDSGEDVTAPPPVEPGVIGDLGSGFDVTAFVTEIMNNLEGFDPFSFDGFNFDGFFGGSLPTDVGASLSDLADQFAGFDPFEPAPPPFTFGFSDYHYLDFDFHFDIGGANWGYSSWTSPWL